MAMPKKGSRLITVDGTEYRWRIRRKGTACLCCSPVGFAAELAEDARQVLVVSYPVAWLDSGPPDAVAITPRVVAASIREALARGWEPEQPGTAFAFKPTVDELTAVLGTTVLCDATSTISA